LTTKEAPFLNDLSHLYQQAGELHGEICAGIILGVRMAVLGCSAIDIPEPRAPESRTKLLVWVEIARCATDGIQSTTGCSLGKHTLILVDYGVLAATFLNLDTAAAVRVSVHPAARTRARALFPLRHDLKQVYLEAYTQLPDEELFVLEKVRVTPPHRSGDASASKHAVCTQCGEEVLRGQEIREGDRLFCHRCARLPLYYEPLCAEH
jgi:formylmethanofuran dehydrogenase subunit E